MAQTALVTARGWRSFELHLVTAGIALHAPMLTIQPLDAQALRYSVPAEPHLIRAADGLDWLKWDKARIGLVLDDEDVRYDPSLNKPDENRFLAQMHIQF